MGSRDGGADGTTNGARRAEPEKPSRSLRPLSTIGTVAAPGSRRTLTFPAEQLTADEQPDLQREKRERTRAETIVPAALEARVEEDPPAQQPVLRWTTPNRRPPSPRAVERAARSSDRLLRSSDDAPNETTTNVREERPSDRSTVPTGLLAGVPADVSSAAGEPSAADVSSVAGEPSAVDVSSADLADASSAKVIELSASDLESDRDLAPKRKTSNPPPLPKRPSFLAGLAAITRAARATEPVPPPLAPPGLPRPTLRSGAVDPAYASRPAIDAPRPVARAIDPLTPPLGSRALGSPSSDVRVPRPEPRTMPLGSSPLEALGSTAAYGSPPSDIRAPRTEPLPAPLRPLAAADARAPELHVTPRAASTEPPRSAEPLVEPARAPSTEVPPRAPEPPHVSTALSVSPGAHVARAPAGESTGVDPKRRLRRFAVPLIASHAALAAIVALLVGVGRAPAAAAAAREPRIVIDERSPLSGASMEPAPLPPLGGCLTGVPRKLAPRAQIGPGLDVAVLETGFAVGLASGTTEALGVRVEGSGLRVAETVRVRTPSIVSRVTIDPGRDDDDGLDLRLDSEDARTVFAGENPAFRVVARGGGVMAMLDAPHGMRPRFLWPLPRAARPARAAARPGPQKPPVYAPSGVARPVARARLKRPAPAVPEIVRVAGRDDGGAVVAIRRPAMLLVGLVDGSLTPAGPLVSIVRKGATIGAPAVASWRGGGVVAWAERPFGASEFDVVVAGFAPGSDGATALGPIHVIGRGMSPTVAALPDGDLLLAYADGASGAHRVVARRLAGDLEPRGEPLVVSPESVNAGQPVVAVRADGRAIVAFFAADRGRSGSVHATPLACDPGL